MRTKGPATALVLGASVWPDGEASPTLSRRIEHAISLFQSQQIEHIIASGGLGQYPPSEARVMQAICLDAGVPEARISLEDRASNTFENIRFSMPLTAGARLIVVTDRYHAPRAWLTARMLGANAEFSCPAMRGTPPLRVLKSWLREALALPFYAAKLVMMRLSGQL